MAALPGLITVAQYRQLPEDSGHKYELRHGEMVAASHPENWRWGIQRRLVDLLQQLSQFVIGMEFPLRAIQEFDLRAANVAALARHRDAATDPDGGLSGAAELVIEVRSGDTIPRAAAMR